MCAVRNVLYVEIPVLNSNLSEKWEMLWSLAFLITTEL